MPVCSKLLDRIENLTFVESVPEGYVVRADCEMVVSGLVAHSPVGIPFAAFCEFAGVEVVTPESKKPAG